MSYTINWHNNDIIVSYDGIVKFKDLYEVIDMLHLDPRFEKTTFQLNDFLKVEKFAINDLEAQVLGTIDNFSSKWTKKIKLAIVASNPKFLETVKFYKEKMKGSNWNIKVFKDYHKAYEWCIN